MKDFLGGRNEMLAGNYTPFLCGCLSTPYTLPEWLTQLLSLVLSVGRVANSHVVPRHSPALCTYKPCSVWTCHMEHVSLW